MTVDLDALIAGARKLPRQFQDAQLPDSAYDEDSALAELDAVGYVAVVASNRLADALESALAELRQERERADEAASHAVLALAGRRNAVAALSRAEETIVAAREILNRGDSADPSREAYRILTENGKQKEQTND